MDRMLMRRRGADAPWRRPLALVMAGVVLCLGAGTGTCDTVQGGTRNGERRQSADDRTNLIVVYGTVVGADGVTPWPDGAEIHVRNARTTQDLVGIVGDQESGRYEIAFVEFTSNDAAAVGDSLVFSIDPPWRLTPPVLVLARPDIESRLALVDLHVLPLITSGACCFPDGACQLLTSEACTTAGGVYLGNSTTCEPNPCPHILPGSCSSQASDTDGNGRYDELEFSLGLVFTTAGSYSWSGSLEDSDGNPIASDQRTGELQAGDQTVTFLFPGSLIGAHGANGPFSLRNVQIDLAGGGHLAVQTACQTAAYSVAEFEGGGCFAGQTVVVPLSWDLQWPLNDRGTVRFYIGGNGQFDPNALDLSTVRLNGTVAPMPGGAGIVPQMSGFVGPVLVVWFPRGQAVRSFADLTPGFWTPEVTASFSGGNTLCLRAQAQVVLYNHGDGNSTGVDSEDDWVGELKILNVAPNPTPRGCRISYMSPDPGSVGFEIYDASGRCVRSIGPEAPTAGVAVVLWDGLDSQGRRPPAGLYFVEGRSRGGSTRSRVILIQ